MLYHQKFEHCSACNIDKTLQRPMSTVLGFCEACAVGFGESHSHNAFKDKPDKPKQVKKEFKKEIEEAKTKHNYKPGERLSTDMFCPWTSSQGGRVLRGGYDRSGIQLWNYCCSRPQGRSH